MACKKSLSVIVASAATDISTFWRHTGPTAHGSIASYGRELAIKHMRTHY